MPLIFLSRARTVGLTIGPPGQNRSQNGTVTCSVKSGVSSSALRYGGSHPKTFRRIVHALSFQEDRSMDTIPAPASQGLGAAILKWLHVVTSRGSTRRCIIRYRPAPARRHKSNREAVNSVWAQE